MAGRPSVASFFLDSFRGPDESNIPGKDQISETLKNKPPVWQNDSNFSASSCRLTWLGHATVLAEVDGCTILADPVFSDRASFVQFAGPRRYTDPACTVEDLPKVDAVIISHNHYDHLDRDSVTKLTELQPNISWFVPEGTAQWLIDNTTVSPEKVHDMTWWQEEKLEKTNLKIVLTPANHWCKRSVMSDDNKMLWGSFAVIGPTKRFWFGGDTGYCEAFKQIGLKYGPFDLAAIPIGSYQPNWFMKYQHVHPGEAVEIHKDINCKKSLGIHWGTFKQNSGRYYHYMEPAALLDTFLDKSGLDTSQFVITHVGGYVES